MQQRPDLVGRQFGNYQLLHLLGTGGFAQVYLGRHINLETQAAIKVLHTQLSPASIDAFRREARTIAHLLHPHIIRVFDFDVAGSTPFLVMDYAAGGTMRERYPEGSIVPLTTIVSSIQQIAEALQYAHDEKLIHRDIKPENILLDRHDNVLLSDFGIALATQSSRNQNTQDVIGTAAYMSPEQIQGKPRPASDQYALGIVVYEWLCGTRPFEGSLTELWSQHMFASPPSLRKKVPTLFPKVEQVVMTALEKDPKQRFPDIRAFADALTRAVEENPQVGTKTLKQSVQVNQEKKQSRAIPPTLAASPLPFPATVKASNQTDLPVPGIAPRNKNVLIPSNSLPHFVPVKIHHKGFWLVLLVGLALLVGIVPLLPWNTLLAPSESHSSPWEMFGGNPAHTEWNQQEHTLTIKNISQLKLLWSYNTQQFTIATPAASDSWLYLGTRGIDNQWGEFYAFDVSCTSNCQPAWTYTVGGDIFSSPAVNDDAVYFGAYNETLYGFSSICTIDCQSVEPFTTFSIQSDTECMNQPLNFNCQSASRSPRTPVIAGNRLYFNADDGLLYAFDVSGFCCSQPLWTSQIDTPLTVANDKVLLTAPAVANDLLYDIASDGTFYTFDTNCVNVCQPLWSYKLDSDDYNSSPAVGNHMVYVGTQKGDFYAFDASCMSNCQPLWHYSTVGIDSSAAVSNKMVYVGASDGKLYAFSATCRKDCQPLWSYATKGDLYSAPVIAGGVLYAASQDHHLYAFDASCIRNCKPIWQYDMKNGNWSAPIVANGKLYMVTSQGVLLCFGVS